MLNTKPPSSSLEKDESFSLLSFKDEDTFKASDETGKDLLTTLLKGILEI